MRCSEKSVISRRAFLRGLAGAAVAISPGAFVRRGGPAVAAEATPAIGAARPGEGVFGFIQRTRGVRDTQLYARILGAANEFKEGDAIVGVAAADAAARETARALLAQTRLADIDAQPLHPDGLFDFITPQREGRARDPLSELTLAQFKQFLLTSDDRILLDAEGARDVGAQSRRIDLAAPALEASRLHHDTVVRNFDGPIAKGVE